MDLYDCLKLTRTDLRYESVCLDVRPIQGDSELSFSCSSCVCLQSMFILSGVHGLVLELVGLFLEYVGLSLREHVVGDVDYKLLFVVLLDYSVGEE